MDDRDRRRRHAQAAETTGLAAGTPVIVGTIDAAAEAISVGVLDAGDMMLMYGSTIFTIVVAERTVEAATPWRPFQMT